MWKNLLLGAVGGLAGLAAMEVARRLTNPFVKTWRRGAPVFTTDSEVPFGVRHRPDESATDAIARITYENVLRRQPSPRTQRAMSWAIHIGYGLACAGAFGALARRPRHAVRTGALFGAALWLLGDEILSPVLGLSDKPTEYHPTAHAQALLTHLGYGVATVATTNALARKMHVC
jgi:hypothetical protein